jgi:hypothetical protein
MHVLLFLDVYPAMTAALLAAFFVGVGQAALRAGDKHAIAGEPGAALTRQEFSPHGVT